MRGLIKFFIKNYKKIVFFMVGVSIIYFLMFQFFMYSYIKEELVHINTKHYSGDDITVLCPKESCSTVVEITGNNTIIYGYEGNSIVRTGSGVFSDDYIYLNGGIFLDKNFDFFYRTDTKLVNIKPMSLEEGLWSYYIVFLSVFTILFINILATSLKEEREDSLRLLMSNEAMLANKAMILITENIHHELNTPMEVIENKIDKIKEMVTPLLDADVLNKEEILEDFSLIEESSESVHNILYRMKGFKHIRYSNGNKTLYDILHGAFRVISVSESNFSYFIDKDFKRYRLGNVLLKNADLLNITINHIKNSLTACSTEIHIKNNGFDGEHVFMRIIDNGNGIPKTLQKSIFEANFSTKDVPGQISGNGLYLNKSILSSSDGDVRLIESSIYGTTFEIMLPSTLVENV